MANCHTFGNGESPPQIEERRRQIARIKKDWAEPVRQRCAFLARIEAFRSKALIARCPLRLEPNSIPQHWLICFHNPPEICLAVCLTWSTHQLAFTSNAAVRPVGAAQNFRQVQTLYFVRLLRSAGHCPSHVLFGPHGTTAAIQSPRYSLSIQAISIE